MDKLRYWLFGKAIQRAMERAEEAGREAERYAIKGRLAKKDQECYELKRLWAETQLQREKELKAKIAFDKSQIDEIVNIRLSKLDHSVNPDDVLTAAYKPDGTTRLIFLNKEQLNTQEIHNLKQEASLFKNGRLWKIINSTLKQQAEGIMFTKATSYDDMKAGKSMLRTLDIQENILDTIEKF